MKIVFATRNPHKIIEVVQLYADLPITFISMDDVGIHDDIVEDQDSFEGNALKKARHVLARGGMPTIADDSGICIDALDGAPGVYSARWAGEGASCEDIMRHTCAMLKGVPEEQRTARFVSCATLVVANGEWVEFGYIDGKLVSHPRGEHREQFPYDALFVPLAGDGRTFGEMTIQEKNGIEFSHRAKAFAALRTHIMALAGFGE